MIISFVWYVFELCSACFPCICAFFVATLYSGSIILCCFRDGESWIDKFLNFICFSWRRSDYLSYSFGELIWFCGDDDVSCVWCTGFDHRFVFHQLLDDQLVDDGVNQYADLLMWFFFFFNFNYVKPCIYLISWHNCLNFNCAFWIPETFLSKGNGIN